MERSTSSLLLLEAANMNNLGVEHLQNENFLLAMNCFRSALDKARELVTVTENLSIPVPLASREADTATCSTFATQALPIATAISRHDTLDPHQGQPSLQSMLNYTHTQGIFLPSSEVTRASDPLIDCYVCSSVAMFNTALVFHCKGLTMPGKGRSERIRQSQHFYHKVLSMLEVMGCMTGETQGGCRDLMYFLTLATLNNLSVAAMELDDSETSRMYSRETLQFYVAASEQRQLFMSNSNPVLSIRPSTTSNSLSQGPNSSAQQTLSQEGEALLDQYVRPFIEAAVLSLQLIKKSAAPAA